MRRSRWYTLVAVTLAAIMIACGTGNGDDGDGAQEPAEADDQPDTSGRDGMFEFTINGQECGATEIGDEFTGETAQGQYCLVDLSVENVGDEARTLDVISQVAFDADGNRYDADDSLAAAVEFDEVWYTEINPGNSVDGTLVFDVPEGTELTELELHDSFASGGVRVAIP